MWFAVTAVFSWVIDGHLGVGMASRETPSAHCVPVILWLEGAGPRLLQYERVLQNLAQRVGE